MSPEPQPPNVAWSQINTLLLSVLLVLVPLAAQLLASYLRLHIQRIEAEIAQLKQSVEHRNRQHRFDDASKELLE